MHGCMRIHICRRACLTAIRCVLFDLKGQVNLADIFNINSTCCIVSIAVNSLVHHFVIQPHPVTTLIHDPGFPIVLKKLSKGFVPGLVHKLLTKACLQATNQGLSTGYQPRLDLRLPIRTCPQTTNQGLSTSYQSRLVHRLPTKACPQAINQGLSTGYQPRLVHRLPTKACSPFPLSMNTCSQAMYRPWITGISNAISNSYISKLILHQVLLAYDACLYPQSISWIKSNQLVYKVTQIQCILTW